MRNSKFKLKVKKGIRYFTITNFENTGLVKHMFTTRIGGVSKPPFDTLNLGINTQDNFDNILENFQRVFSVLDTKLDNIVISNQIHGTNIRIVNEKDIGKGLESNLNKTGVDGLVTNKTGITLVTFYADCVPLFFLDKCKKVVGLAHAGWRGTVNKIGAIMIDLMIKTYNSRPEDILVGIGPSIGPCCYEVGEEVYKKFEEKFINSNSIMTPTGRGKWQLDLWKANMHTFEEKGVLRENIIVSKICTSCNDGILFSYRKSGGKTGRMAAIIQLI